MTTHTGRLVLDNMCTYILIADSRPPDFSRSLTDILYWMFNQKCLGLQTCAARAFVLHPTGLLRYRSRVLQTFDVSIHRASPQSCSPTLLLEPLWEYQCKCHSVTFPAHECLYCRSIWRERCTTSQFSSSLVY